MSETQDRRPEVLQEVLRLGAGFRDVDRPWVLEALSALGSHLARWNPDQVSVKVAVKDRGSKEQRVTLQVDLPGFPPLVAGAADRHLERALAEAKREVIRQIEDETSAREPKSNRHLRRRTP
ncbi:hypothetical protein [Pseudonocardia sp. T1-2H]|uniref:hypothetical protein n=1 Tax=Pseudonocardia sp. T1-2H TaxID=3128899 RepID=UPI003100E0A3